MTEVSKDNNRNQGEGNVEAARRYDAAQRAFVKSGKVEDPAKSAEQAVSGAEAEDLRKAEREGASHAKK